MEHKIKVVGIGPGNPDYVLPFGLKTIKAAKYLVGGRRALADFAEDGMETYPITGDIPGVMNFIRARLQLDDVVAIVSGDPGYYSLLDALRREFPEELLEVIPGISSIQFAFSRLALPWHDATLLSMHGRRASDEALSYVEGKLLGMLTDTKYNSRTIAALLIELGWPPETRCAACARLSYEDEKITRMILAEAAGAEAVSNCIMVVMG